MKNKQNNQSDTTKTHYLYFPQLEAKLNQLIHTKTKGIESDSFWSHERQSHISGGSVLYENTICQEFQDLINETFGKTGSTLTNLEASYHRLGRETQEYRQQGHYSPQSTVTLLKNEKDTAVKDAITPYKEKTNILQNQLRTQQQLLVSKKERLRQIEKEGNFIYPAIKRVFIAISIIILLIETLIYSSSFKFLTGSPIGIIGFAAIVTGFLFMLSHNYGIILKRFTIRKVTINKFIASTLLFICFTGFIIISLVYLRLKYFDMTNITVHISPVLLMGLAAVSIILAVGISFYIATNDAEGALEGKQVYRTMKDLNDSVKKLEKELKSLQLEMNDKVSAIEMESRERIREYEFPAIENKLIAIATEYNQLLESCKAFALQADGAYHRIIAQYREHFVQFSGSSSEYSKSAVAGLINPFHKMMSLNPNTYIETQSARRPSASYSTCFLIVMSILLGGSTCNDGLPERNIHIVALIDTSQSIQEPQQILASDIVSFTGLEIKNGIIPNTNLTFSITQINGTSVSAINTIRLDIGKEKDEFTIIGTITDFQSQLDSFLRINQVSGYMGQKTCFYYALTNSLNNLSRTKADKKILIALTDAREDCRINFNALTESAFSCFEKKLTDEEALPKNLQGITLVFVHSPIDMKNDIEYRKALAFWKYVLVKRGVTIVEQGRLNLSDLTGI